MTHHEDVHQGRRLVLVGVAVLVVLSGVATAPSPRPQLSHHEVRGVTLLCTTAPAVPPTPSACRVLIHTPIR